MPGDKSGDDFQRLATAIGQSLIREGITGFSGYWRVTSRDDGVHSFTTTFTCGDKMYTVGLALTVPEMVAVSSWTDERI